MSMWGLERKLLTGQKYGSRIRTWVGLNKQEEEEYILGKVR